MILATKSSTPIIGQLATVMGWIMDGIYRTREEIEAGCEPNASLGQKKHLGYVTIGNGALYPGAGVQKNLPPVGDIHITGIVNTAGLMEHLTLQTTRLSTVVALADVIAGGILKILPAEADLSASDPHSEHSHSALLHAHA